MSLQYILSPNQWYPATITQFPNYTYIKDFVDLIDADEQAFLLSSNLHGFIYGMMYRDEEKQQFSSKLVHEFIMRLVDSGKQNEIWIKLNDSLARFGLQEFCLITGLPCHEVSVNLRHDNDRLRNQYFNGRRKITMAMLFQAFHVCQNKEDKFKLGLVMLVECVLTPTGRHIDSKTLAMVENIDSFIEYPWGRGAYFVLLTSLQQSHLQRIHKLQLNQETECKYTLHGYPLAFQYWIYEAFPKIGARFGQRRYKTAQAPRMHRWKPTQFLTEGTIKKFLATKKIKVVAILNPDEEEVEKIWYATLSLPHDNDHHILDDIAKGENNDPIRCHDDYPTTHTHISFGIGENSSGQSNHLTKQEIQDMFSAHTQQTKKDMKAMLKVHRQHIASDISHLCNSFIDVSKKHYEALLQNQQELFQRQHNWHEEHFQQHEQSEQQRGTHTDLTMKAHFENNLNYMSEENTSILNKLSECQSNMQNAIACLREDISLHRSFNQDSASQTFTPGSQKDKGKIQFHKHFPLEDYPLEKYTKLTNWMLANPPDALWNHVNLYKRSTLEAILDITQAINIKLLEKELILLRQYMDDASNLVSKKYAILDFEFQMECDNHNTMKKSIKEKTASIGQRYLDIRKLEAYMIGITPMAGKAWAKCNSILIPCECPGNSWYLLHVNLEEWKLKLYDCSNTIHTPYENMEFVKPILNVIQYLLLSSSFFIGLDFRKNTKKSMGIDIISGLPCANNRPNCSIFLLKYIECLVLGYPIKSISSDRMLMYRRKIAVDLCWNKYFPPP